MNTVIQTYLRAAVALSKMPNIPYETGNSIKIGDNYVVAFKSNATSYIDYKNAYLTRYESNEYLGDMADLCAKYGLDPHFSQDQHLPVHVLEWVDANGKTASERFTKEMA
jgi:hypothetical protein